MYVGHEKNITVLGRGKKIVPDVGVGNIFLME